MATFVTDHAACRELVMSWEGPEPSRCPTRLSRWPVAGIEMCRENRNETQSQGWFFLACSSCIERPCWLAGRLRDLRISAQTVEAASALCHKTRAVLKFPPRHALVLSAGGGREKKNQEKKERKGKDRKLRHVSRDHCWGCGESFGPRGSRCTGSAKRWTPRELILHGSDSESRLRGPRHVVNRWRSFLLHSPPKKAKKKKKKKTPAQERASTLSRLTNGEDWNQAQTNSHVGVPMRHVGWMACWNTKCATGRCMGYL